MSFVLICYARCHLKYTLNKFTGFLTLVTHSQAEKLVVSCSVATRLSQSKVSTSLFGCLNAEQKKEREREREKVISPVLVMDKKNR